MPLESVLFCKGRVGMSWIVHRTWIVFLDKYETPFIIIRRKPLIKFPITQDEDEERRYNVITLGDNVRMVVAYLPFDFHLIHPPPSPLVVRSRISVPLWVRAVYIPFRCLFLLSWGRESLEMTVRSSFVSYCNFLRSTSSFPSIMSLGVIYRSGWLVVAPVTLWVKSHRSSWCGAHPNWIQPWS